MSIRPVKHISGTTPHVEGAGVNLQRVFGFGDPSLTDPFLMMDDFRNDRPQDYLKGFPWHPHRGIETIGRSHDRVPPEGAQRWHARCVRVALDLSLQRR